MYRWCVAFVLGVMLLAVAVPAYPMRKFEGLSGSQGSVNPQVSNVASKRRATPLTAAEQAAIKRRILTARTGLKQIHVHGDKPGPVPPEALDALADWRATGAPDVEVWWDADTRTPFFIKGSDLILQPAVPLAKRGMNSQAALALGTFSRLPAFLGLRDPENELRVVSTQTDRLGLTHVRLQQMYRGHDVWARDLYTHFTDDSRLNLINGRWAPTPVADNLRGVLDLVRDRPGFVVLPCAPWAFCHDSDNHH